MVSLAELADGIEVSIDRLAQVARCADRDHEPLAIRVGRRSRVLYVPSHAMKKIQRALYERWLAGISVAAAVHSRPGRGVITNARCHLGHRFAVANDFADCFPSVRPRQVAAALERAGFAPDAAGLIMRLCTTRFDAELATIAGNRRATYTRYVDDVIISSEEEPTWANRTVAHLAEQCGFRINEAKRRGWGPNEPATVTGIVVSSSLQPDPAFVADLTTTLLKAERCGLALDVDAVRGRIAWVTALDPERGATLARRLSSWIGRRRSRRRSSRASPCGRTPIGGGRLHSGRRGPRSESMQRYYSNTAANHAEAGHE